jgi:hypothetical protein
LVNSAVEGTLGVGHEGVIRREASMRRAFVNGPDTIDVAADRYLEKVAEEVQQYFQDCFIDTTWPECPFHRRHPLWLRNGYWTCEQLSEPVARMGQLRAARDDALEPLPATLRALRFTPATRGGIAVRQRVIQAIRFEPPPVCRVPEASPACPRRYRDGKDIR